MGKNRALRTSPVLYILVLLVLSTALSASPVFASASTPGVDQLSVGGDADAAAGPGIASTAAGPTITVQGTTRAALQAALDQARDKATASQPATVVVPAGTWSLSEPVFIYSNTKLQLSSKTVIASTGSNACIYAGGPNTKHKGYTTAQNISITGGTWQAPAACTQIMVIEHTKNATIANLTVKGGSLHPLNATASAYLTVRNVVFRDEYSTQVKGGEFCECVHLDIDTPVSAWPDGDGTPPGNVVIDGCTFSNVDACIGRHANLKGQGASYTRYKGTSLTVKNCKFVNVRKRVINVAQMDNVNIVGNTLSGSMPETFMRVNDSKNVKVSAQTRLAPVIYENGATGTVDCGIITNASSYAVRATDSGTNLTVKNLNVTYIKSNAVRARKGATLTVQSSSIVSPTNSAIAADGSGTKLTVSNCTIKSPKGDGIYVSGSAVATISNCIIKDTTGSGIAMDGAKNTTVSGTTIMNAKGMGMRLSNVTGSTVKNNNVQNSTDHGIFLGGSCNKVSVTGNTSNSKINTASKAEFMVAAQCTNITLKNNRYGPRQFWIDTRSISQSGNSQRSYASLSLKSEPEVASGVWKRLAGADRFGTMSAVVGAGWAAGSGGTVVVATAKGFADALAASGVAGVERAPVVITAPGSLSPQAAEQLRRIRPKRVVIAGGPSAVSDSVASAVARAAGVAPVRLWGQNARRTAEALALAYKGSWSGTAILATQRDYADALSAAPAAYAMRMPVFLVSGPSSLDAQTVSAMRACGITRVQVVGGEKAVGEPVMRALRAAGFQVPDALAGTDRYGTSAEVARWALARGMSANNMGVATGRSCYDALCGAALCGRNNAVLVLADARNSSNVGSGAASVTRPNRLAIRRGYVFGGPAAVSTPVFNALDASTS